MERCARYRPLHKRKWFCRFRIDKSAGYWRHARADVVDKRASIAVADLILS
jgi:hypothetical protein